MPKEEVIDLDSDSEFSDQNTKPNKELSEVVNLSSDDEETATNEHKNEVIDLENEVLVEVNSQDIKDNNKVSYEDERQKEALTPQQEMRKRMAEAAERRLKSSFEKDESSESIKHKKQKVSSPPKLDNIIPLPKQSISDKSSRIRLIANPKYCSKFGVDADKDTVSLYDLVGSNNLVKTYQFNMLIDFDYFCQFVSSKDCEFILVNKSDDEHLHVKDESWQKYKISTIDVSSKLPKFGTHHTKMMINFYKGNICRIILHTMNITEADHVIQTQMCWMSPPLEFQKDASKWLDFNQPNISLTENTGLAFKRDFIAYLMTYENNDINKLIDQVAKFDFSPIDVVFIASSPGHYQYGNWNQLTKPTSKPMFGYGRLWQVVHILKLESLMGKLIGQVSTIAGPCDNWKRNTLIHVLTSCVEKGYPMMKRADYKYQPNKNHVEPLFVWPTVSEVLKSQASALSGIALHLTSKGKWAAYERQFEEIKKYFYKWSATSNPKLSKAGRSNLSPHVKTYTVTEDNFKTLKWILMTSANISHQAWGKPKSYNIIEYDICSFEAGVFVDPKLLKADSNTEGKKPILVPTYGTDVVENEDSLSGNVFKIGQRLPYDTPLVKYTSTDIAWSQPDSDQYFR